MSSPESARYLGGEPTLGSRFLFEVDGVEIGLFASVRGLQVSSQTESIVEGGQNGFTYRLPGRLEWPNITFTRGLTDADALFDWMNKTAGEGFAAAGNKLTRSTGAITAIVEQRRTDCARGRSRASSRCAGPGRTSAPTRTTR